MRIVPNKSFQSRPIQWYRRLKTETSVRNNHGRCKPQGLQDTNDLCTGSTMEIPMLSIPTLLAMMSVILDENAWQSIH
jgi:hypothetical protein